MAAAQTRIELIPWDYDSNEHLERMYLQRVSCGWRSEEVIEGWATRGRQGRKTLYSVVVGDDLPDRERPAPSVAIPGLWYKWLEGIGCLRRKRPGDKWVNPTTGERDIIDYWFLRKTLQEE